MTWLEPILDGAQKELQGALMVIDLSCFLCLVAADSLKICTTSGTG